MDQVTRLFIGKTEGAFVIRFSGSTPGTYTLSVMGAGGATIHHWRIGVENGNFVLNEKSFSNFEELVKYYKINPKLIAAIINLLKNRRARLKINSQIIE